MNSTSTTSGLNNRIHKRKKLIKALKIIFIGDTVPQKIVHFYVYLILIGAILLYLPFSLTSYPNEYSKIINEDYFNVGGYSALAGKIIDFDLINQAKELGYHKLANNLYLVLDPISNSPKVVQTDAYTFLDAIFVAASAFSDTGLTTMIVKSTYSVFGQVVIALLIQIGGIGFIVIAYLL